MNTPLKSLTSFAFLLSATELYCGASLPKCGQEIHREWVSLEHREAKGIGYGVGYSTLETFFSHSFQSDWLTFMDLRGHYFDDGRWAANAGVGLRIPREYSTLVYGLNAYYDWRETEHARFQQVGAGLEVLGKKWDLHLNAYIPISKHNFRYGKNVIEIKGHHLFFWQHHEFSMLGGDLELGWKLFKTKYCDLHALGGVYYFQGEYGKNIEGGLFRLTSKLTRFFTVEAQTSYDTLFNWITQGSIAFNFAYGPKVHVRHSKLTCPDRLYVQENLVSKPSRFEIIVTDKHQTRATATDAVSGDPLHFVFVDNLLGSSDGTYEHPYPTLKEAEANAHAGDLIYVFSGDGSSKGMDQGIVLAPYQQLLGSGIPYTFNTRFGDRTLPALSDQTPVITSSGSATLTLSDHNIVRGLHLIGASGISDDTIFGDGITGSTITQNILSGAGRNDLMLSRFSGDLVMKDNTSGSVSGVVIQTQGSWNCTIANNIFTNDPAVGTSISIENAAAGDALVFAHIDSNQLLQSSTGISTALWSTGTLAGFIENNTISKIDFVGISTGGVGNSTVKHLINNNHLSGSPSNNGILIACTGTSSCTAEVKNNTLTGTNCKFQFNKSSGLFAKLRLFDNTSSDGYLLSNVLLVSSPLFVESPTLNISGLSPPFLNNQGTVSTSGAGTISFVGFNP